jgi:penicillin-insensitive murein endopeptidase
MRPAAVLVGLLLAVLPRAVAAQETDGETARAIAAARAKLPADAAKVLFGNVAGPSSGAPRSIGGFARGCLAGGVSLPLDGPDWQVMRPLRGRMWGHPRLIAFLERFAAKGRTVGWPGLLVGDMSQPRGGPMITGHASHTIGLDADVWFLPMPDRRFTAAERETVSAVSMVSPDRRIDRSQWTESRARLLKAAAEDPAVARIFVNPAIKATLCGSVGGDRGWLRKIRPWWGHDHHFHVRLTCTPGDRDCREQDPVPKGDGCGADLAWWLGPEPWKPSPPEPERPPLKLADLPAACADVLAAP